MLHIHRHNRKQNWTLNVGNIKESIFLRGNQVQNKGNAITTA